MHEMIKAITVAETFCFTMICWEGGQRSQILFSSAAIEVRISVQVFLKREIFAKLSWVRTRPSVIDLGHMGWRRRSMAPPIMFDICMILMLRSLHRH